MIYWHAFITIVCNKGLHPIRTMAKHDTRIVASAFIQILPMPKHAIVLRSHIFTFFIKGVMVQMNDRVCNYRTHELRSVSI